MRTTRKPDPITCKTCGFSSTCSPCYFRDVDYKTRIGTCKKCRPGPPPIEIHNTNSGIGDAICGVYAAAGLARTGRDVVFYTPHAGWLKRVSAPRMRIVESRTPRGHDMGENYDQQLKTQPCRKQFYCDNIARLAGVEPFKPAKPRVNRKAVHVWEPPRGEYVVLAPFTAWASRQWPTERWRELAKLAVADGYNVAAIGASDHEPALKNTFAGVKGAYWFYGMGGDYIDNLMLKAEAVAGNDSGMAHLGGLLGVRTVAVHTHMSHKQLFSLTNVISAQAGGYDCLGCNWQPSRGFRAECRRACPALRDTTAETVWQLMKEP